jgi:hypothetical protein
MKEFRVGKAIRRLYTTKSYVRGFPDRQWALEMGFAGVRVWPKGYRSQARLLPWKFIIGQALMWAKSECPEPRAVSVKETK